MSGKVTVRVRRNKMNKMKSGDSKDLSEKNGFKVKENKDFP